jgi:hypothetical protein
MADGGRLPDEAWVVRCGLPPFTARPLIGACGEHAEGVFGFSVQSAANLLVVRLATACRNKSVGFTTVGKVRQMGYDVVPTRGDFHHATVIVPRDWSSQAAAALTGLFTAAVNLAPRT